MDKSPDAFRTISEVAEFLDTPAHVLRFWETRFPQVRPVKRAGGRRYYRPNDVALLTGIKHLLHDEGMTIRGVQKILREQGVRHVAGLSGNDLGDAIEQDAEEALGAALKSFARPEADPLAVPEAETAQILALETALKREPAAKPSAASEVLPLFPDLAAASPARVEPPAPIAPAPASDNAPPPPPVMAEDIPEAAFAEDVAAEDDPAPILNLAAQDVDLPNDSPHVENAALPSLADLLARLRQVPPGGLAIHSGTIAPLRDRLFALHRRMAATPRHPDA